jgi:uncharacterized alpha-E superfamily protein
MQPKSLEDRVTLLENNLRGLPERVGSLETRVTELTVEFVQFRGEVRSEFSATREELRKEIRDSNDALHKKLDAKFDDKIDGLHAEMHALHAVAMLEIGKAFERSMSLTRTLHEEAMSQIKLIKHG